MKVKLIEKENSLLLEIDDYSEEIKKDNPINFQNLIEKALNLKFRENIEYTHLETEDIQNKVIVDIISEIVEKYNQKCASYEAFKIEIDEKYKGFI